MFKKPLILFILLFLLGSIWVGKRVEAAELFDIYLGFKGQDYGEPLVIGPSASGSATIQWFVKAAGRHGVLQDVICETSGGWSGRKEIQGVRFDHGSEAVSLPSEDTSYTLTCYEKNNPDNKKSATVKIIVLDIDIEEHVKAFITPKFQTMILGEKNTIEYGLKIVSIGDEKIDEKVIDSIKRSLKNVKCTLKEKTSLDSEGIIRSRLDSLQNRRIVGVTMIKAINPSDDTFYVMECEFDSNWDHLHHKSSASTLVKVAKVDFDIYPQEYYVETTDFPLTVALGWESKYFEKCEASSEPNVWSGEKPLSGTETVQINGPTKFTLTCSGIDGDMQRTKTITKYVREKSLSSTPVWITAQPSQVLPGEEVIITLGITRAFDHCDAYSYPDVKILAFSNETDQLEGLKGGKMKIKDIVHHFPDGPRKKYPTLRALYKALEEGEITIEEYNDLRNDILYPHRHERSFSDIVFGTGDVRPQMFSCLVRITEDTSFGVVCRKHVRVFSSMGSTHQAHCYGKGGNTAYCVTDKDWKAAANEAKNKGLCSTATECKTEAMWQISNNKEWKEKYTTKIPITNGDLTKPGGGWKWDPKGEFQLKKEKTSYQMISSGGSTSASVLVHILSPDSLQVSLTADPTEIEKGGSTTLTYNSENADEDRYCTITSTDNVWTDDSIPPNTEGSHSVTLNEAKTYTFTFTCYDKDGNSKSATAEVTVTEQGTTTTTTTTTTTKPPCRIMEFTINGKDNEDQNPIMVWVNSVVKGHWLANGFCTDCSINCSPSGCNWSQDNIGTQGDHQFRITQSNLYTYTLTCWGENQDTDTETLDLKVRAVNLPKWREIIPILPFLRGLFPWGK